MASLSLKQLCKSYGASAVLHDINLEVQDGEFVVFVGPSGCGKSTLLRCIAGLEEISSGTLQIDGRTVNELPAAQRGLAMVFQSYALYPHMSVAENMGFSLKLAGVAKAQIAAQVAQAAEVLQISHLLDRKPAALSGGQRQRVAIGRAIVRKPGVFLFDEPLSNLDASLRGQMRVELARLHRELGTTMLYVTHDQSEAMTLADRIVVFNGGRIEQVGSPMALYRRPANRFVASFLGSPRINLLDATVRQQGADRLDLVLADGQGLSLAQPPQALDAWPVGSALSLGLRAEHLQVLAPSDEAALPAGACELPARVELVEFLGDSAHAHLSLGGTGGRPALIAQVGADSALQPGMAVRLRFSAAQALLFDAQGNALHMHAQACTPTCTGETP